MVTQPTGVKRAVVNGVTWTIGAEAADVINVGIQLTISESGFVVDCAERVSLPFYLSDDANGDSIAGTAPSAGIAIGTDGLLIENIANKAGQVTSESNGDIDIDVDEAGIDTWYAVLVMPDGSLAVSPAITFA